MARQKSPYLLQHAHNPVDWYPWGEEAFAEARRSDRPLFLSVGYATCHWCHVMERESFEDAQLAARMNELFVNVKVDREERPDVDRLYMAYVQAATGSGGWPMSVWLTPGLEPFLGGTYFPPTGRPGQPGFRDLIERVGQAWQEERERIRAGASQTMTALEKALRHSAAPQAPGESVQSDGFQWFRKVFDHERGGFGGAPKFPRPAVFHFLLRWFARSGEIEAAEMTLETLREMAQGGIRDHVGGGFHRYSVDARWHVPHFEKMLYDQAQLARSYLEALQLTGEGAHGVVAREILDYVLRDLTSTERGAFHSAEDADSLPEAGGSQKVEGAYYVWSWTELQELLGADAPLFCDHYGATQTGNAQDPHGELTGKNVLHERCTVAETAVAHGVPLQECSERLAAGRRRLREARSLRPRPLLDDKVICAWNGLTISALARGFQALGEGRYLDAAVRAAEFVTTALWDEEKRTLYRRWRLGEAAHDGYLEDYALLVEGLLDLYETNFDCRWLIWAQRLTERQIELFYDRDDGGFFANGAEDESVLLRLKDDHDGAEPSGNSVAAANLLRLAAMLDREDWRELAEETIRYYTPWLRDRPQALPQMLATHDLLLHPPTQVVFSGGDASGRGELIRAVHGVFQPNRVLLCADAEFTEAFGKARPDLVALAVGQRVAAAQVCRGTVCQLPTADSEVVVRQLGSVRLVGLDGASDNAA
ncbi:MAG: thioredoxin domain-containing protein [bacterium]